MGVEKSKKFAGKKCEFFRFFHLQKIRTFLQAESLEISTFLVILGEPFPKG